MLNGDLPTTAPVWLASRSPRRRRMLAEAGATVCVRPSEIDDGSLTPGRGRPVHWAMALAYLKARCVADAIRCEQGIAALGTVLAADTICVHRGAILGQPGNAAEARSMLLRMREDTPTRPSRACACCRFAMLDAGFSPIAPRSATAVSAMRLWMSTSRRACGEARPARTTSRNGWRRGGLSAAREIRPP